MKFYIKILILLIIVLQISNVMASENITGAWQGKMVGSPEAEQMVHFIIDQNADGSYSARLNSSDQRTLKNVKASSVVYDSGILKVDVAELGLFYEGVVKKSKIEGEWKQEGISFPLNLSQYEKPKLSKEDMDKLFGQWYGKFPVPRFLTLIFRFKMTEKGEFVAFADNPDQGAYDIPVTDVELNDDNFRLIIPSAHAEYKGKLADNEIVGEYKQGFVSIPLTLKKIIYMSPVNKLSSPKETKKDYETLVREMVGKTWPVDSGVQVREK